MIQSVVTSKGQTTVPRDIRAVWGIEPSHRLIWELLPDGSATVRPQPSAMELFGCIKTSVPFPGIKEERMSAQEAAAQHAATEGLE